MESGTNMFYTENDRGGFQGGKRKESCPQTPVTIWLEVGLHVAVPPYKVGGVTADSEAPLCWDGSTGEVFIFLHIYTILIRTTVA